MTKSQIQAEALAFLTDFLTKTREGTCWITQNKGINMRFIWDTVRENYYGAFKTEKDRFGQYKIPYPLTETVTWENVKNIDLDTKDINVRTTDPAFVDDASVVRYIVKDWMRKTFFGEKMNLWQMYYVLDGHLIVKTLWNPAKKDLTLRHVDNRNCFYDFHCDDIQTTPFMERSVQDLTELKATFTDWINLDKIKGEHMLPKLLDESKEYESPVPEVEVYEYWGKIKKSWITGKSKDDEWVEGTIWASGLTGQKLIHKIALNEKGYKPYEDVAFEDAPNRHPGRGIGEKLLFLQIYINTIYNIRRNNNLVLMNQLFKFKEGAGITQEKIQALVAGGAIGLQNMADFERVDTKNLNFTESINEESNLVNLANRVTSSQEPATGESLPASMPATNAIIQRQSVKSSHQLRQERFGLFLTRMFSRQLLDKLTKVYRKGDIFSLDAQDKRFNTDKRNIALNLANRNNTDPESVLDSLDHKGSILVKLDKDIDFTKHVIEFFVTDESFDKNTILQNLQHVLFNYNQIPLNDQTVGLLREIYDILGIDPSHISSKPQEQPQGQPQEMEQPQEGQQTEAQLVGQQTNRVANQIEGI